MNQYYEGIKGIIIDLARGEITKELALQSLEEVFNKMGMEPDKKQESVGPVTMGFVESDGTERTISRDGEDPMGFESDDDEWDKKLDEIEELKSKIEALEDELWIKCSERMPNERTTFIAYNGDVMLAWYFDGRITDLNDKTISNLTHWMPLPEPPGK
jgi:hypothetical protein